MGVALIQNKSSNNGIDSDDVGYYLESEPLHFSPQLSLPATQDGESSPNSNSKSKNSDNDSDSDSDNGNDNDNDNDSDHQTEDRMELHDDTQVWYLLPYFLNIYYLLPVSPIQFLSIDFSQYFQQLGQYYW